MKPLAEKLVAFVVVWMGSLISSVPAWGNSNLRENLQITVRVYDYVSLPEAMLKSAFTVGGGILDDAGVRTNWLRCGGGTSTSDSPRCDERKGPADLVLRILHADKPKSSASGDSAFGEAFVPADGSPGVYATVYYEGVEFLGEQEAAPRSHILGWVIAHELGHLLLGLNSHSWTGLMRARWSREDFRPMARGAFSFTPQQCELLRVGVRVRMDKEQSVQTAEVNTNPLDR